MSAMADEYEHAVSKQVFQIRVFQIRVFQIRVFQAG